MSGPRTWIELVDPKSGRKVDVEVSWHSDWSAIDAGTEDQAFWNVSSKIAGVLSSAFDGLSDLEETPGDGKTPREPSFDLNGAFTKLDESPFEPVSQGDKDFAQELADAIRDMKVDRGKGVKG